MTARILLNENCIRYNLFLFRAAVCNRFCCDSFNKYFCWTRICQTLFSAPRAECEQADKKSRPHQTYILACVDRENNQVKYTKCCKTWRIRLERGSSGRRRYSFKRMFGESLLRKKKGTL